jgi:hypothetical protein
VADPKASTLVAAVVTAIEAIAAGKYKPERVVTCATFDGRVLDSSLLSVVSLSPDISNDTNLSFGPTNNVMVEYPIDIAVCRKYDGQDDPFDVPEVRRWNEQNEMVRIVKNALRADRTFGGVALYSEIPNTDQTAENTYIEEWAVSFLRLTIQYRHSEVAA